MQTDRKHIYFIAVAVCAFVVCYLLTYSHHIFIADEVSYINRLLSYTTSSQSWTDAINGEVIPNILAEYPLGTSMFLIPFYWIFGYQGIYIANLFYVLVSIWLIYLTVKTLSPSRTKLAIYPLICLPLLYYLHLVMSELPSMMLISAACYFYFARAKSTTNLFLAGLMVGLSIWFRETNALIFIIPIVDLLQKKEFRAMLPLGVGFLVGLLHRLVSAQLTYGNPLFIKDTGYDFSIEYISGNISLYIISLIFLFPLILYPIIQFKTKEQKLINGGIWLFILVHLLYGYNGMKASGIKSILITARFLIPIIPLFVLSLAFITKKWMSRAQSLLPWFAILISIAFHLAFSMNNKSLSSFKDQLNAVNQTESIFLFNGNDPELLELLTPIQATMPLAIADINRLDASPRQLLKSKSYYLIEQRRSDTENRMEKQAELDDKILQYFTLDDLELISRKQNGYQELLLWKVRVD